jgi:hypothetical protein
MVGAPIELHDPCPMKTRAWLEEFAMKVLRPVGQRQAWPPLAMMLMLSPGAAMGREEQADPGARSTYEFLERVEEEIGQAAFDEVPYPHALALAESLTFIDRDACTAASFVGHLRHVQQTRSTMRVLVCFRRSSIPTIHFSERTASPSARLAARGTWSTCGLPTGRPAACPRGCSIRWFVRE